MDHRVIPFKVEHLRGLEIQAGQQDEWLGRDIVSEAQYAALEAFPSFTGIDGERVLGAAGVVPAGIGVCEGWLFGAECLETGGGKWDMLWIAKKIIRFLDATKLDPSYMTTRITVKRGWDSAHRFARILGFKSTGSIVYPHNSGHDYLLYERH